MIKPTLSIIVVGMNHLSYLKALLPSIEANITPPMRYNA